jgi:maltose alpha-D-glucosyltransferase/alpha-amylase
VTAIWLNPVYVSGWTDGGYDIIDFYRVDKRFGDNDDLIELLREAHKRGIRIVMDLVAGHSSDQCEWFLQSREGANLRYSDYYIWPSFKPEEQSAGPAGSEDPDYAALMSAHLSLTRKFVATDAPRGPYYIKNFYDTQPALNFGFADPDPAHPWEQAVDAPGPQSMRNELKNIMSFWMDKGVDGFRVDMAASLVKNDPDKAATIRLWNEDFVPWFDANYPEGILIAEWFNPAQSVALADFDLDFFCHDGQYNYSSLFFFNRGFGPAGSAKPYFAKAGEGELKTWFDLYDYQYQSVQGKGYVCLPSGNHDFNRVCTEGRSDPEELKVAMTFFLTMPGVPFIYYGDEIGLKQNPNAPSTDGSGFRAGCRIPMLWDGTDNAGFSTAPLEKIYIPQDPDPNRMTVEKAEADPNSLLHYVRGLLRLRKEVPALGADASWRLVSSFDQPYPMVYEREWRGERCWVVLNPSGKQVSVTLPAGAAKPELIGGNYKKCTFKQTKKGDVIQISAVSAAILQFPGERGVAGTVGDGHPDKPRVSVGKLDFYPEFASASGLVTPRNVYVWLPEDYTPAKKYAVVYMSDGQNLFDPEKMFNHQEWRVDEVFGGLQAAGKIQDCIVVGVANSFRTRSQEYFPQDVFDRYSPELKAYAESKRMGGDELLGNKYLQFLVEELKPFIDTHYATLTDRDHTFHMGSSMGGLLSSYAVAKYPRVFGGAACLSTHSVLYITNYDAEQASIDPANQCYVDYLQATLRPNGCKLYMDRGDQTLDAQYPKYQDRLDRMFKEAGWDGAHYASRVFPGHAHVESSWASRLEEPVLFLLGAEANRTTVDFVVRDGKSILMDIYQGPERKEGGRPVFLYSFGGAWAMGSRVDALCNPLYDHLCAKGWVCVAIDYRLGSARGRDGKPLITPPEGYNPFQYSIDIGVEDIYAATAWLIAHAEEYNIDPSKIVLSGSSAGAINSMNAEYYICSGHRIAKENLPADFNYAGVVPMAGAVYLTDRADTELQWDRKPCPMCFFHGSADPTVTFDTERGPNRQGFGPKYISGQLDALDVPYMLNEYVDGDHCMALLPIRWFWNEIDSFLDRIVLGGQDLKVHAVERSSKPRTDANWLDTVRPGQYAAVNMRNR